MFNGNTDVFAHMKIIRWILTIQLLLKNCVGIHPVNCSDLKKLRKVSKNGHYAVFPEILGGKSVGVFCDSMVSEPVEYLTLHYYNGGDYPDVSFYHCQGLKDTSPPFAAPGNINYSKIRIDTKTMAVNVSDFSFSSYFWNPLPYGTAGDCYNSNEGGVESTCGVKGFFVIDTRNTGLVVDPSVKWETYGNDTTLAEHKITYGGQKHLLRCGGFCGICRPAGPLRLKYYTGRVDGQWTSWLQFMKGRCNATCDVGERLAYYSRVCKNPKPQQGGVTCVGPTNKIVSETCQSETKCKVPVLTAAKAGGVQSFALAVIVFCMAALPGLFLAYIRKTVPSVKEAFIAWNSQLRDLLHLSNESESKKPAASTLSPKSICKDIKNDAKETPSTVSVEIPIDDDDDDDNNDTDKRRAVDNPAFSKE